MHRVMAELGVLQPDAVDIVYAVYGCAAVGRVAQHHGGEILPQGIQHGIEFRPDVPPEHGALLVKIPVASRVLGHPLIHPAVGLLGRKEPGIRIHHAYALPGGKQGFAAAGIGNGFQAAFGIHHGNVVGTGDVVCHNQGLHSCSSFSGSVRRRNHVW